MRETRHDIAGQTPGTDYWVTDLGFGTPGAHPHIHIQAGLHADEGPGMLTARLLADRLTALEAQGLITGYVSVVPMANPIGMNQFVLGDQSGRFDLYDGRNFNRDYPDLAPDTIARVKGRLGNDSQANAALIRDALSESLAALPTQTPADALRHLLLGLALRADIVLDLHCDGEAEVHLYTQPGSHERLLPLIALLECKAVLLAEVSGGNPFDEAVSRPWRDLALHFKDVPIPDAIASCTVELRGRSDVSRHLAARDAEAILGTMAHMGALALPLPALPAPCAPTPLAGSEALKAPVAGLLSYTLELGTHVQAGDLVAEITNPLTGGVTRVCAGTTGVFYARPATRIAETGKRLGKIAGAEPTRAGLLLSP